MIQTRIKLSGNKVEIPINRRVGIEEKKQLNREALEEQCDSIGALYIAERLFYDMFDDLTLAKQKLYIELAKDIVKEHLGK